MGYELHITRRRQWFEDGDDISREEFVACVRADAEFTYPGRGGEDFADWQSPTSNYWTWLCWQEGRVITKNPEAVFVDKMVAVWYFVDEKMRQFFPCWTGQLALKVPIERLGGQE